MLFKATDLLTEPGLGRVSSPVTVMSKGQEPRISALTFPWTRLLIRAAFP